MGFEESRHRELGCRAGAEINSYISIGVPIECIKACGYYGTVSSEHVQLIQIISLCIANKMLERTV